ETNTSLYSLTPTLSLEGRPIPTDELFPSTTPSVEVEGENKRDYGTIAGAVTTGVVVTGAIVSAVVIGMICWASHRAKLKSASYEMQNKQ
ncbi:hypothetical protein, partial [Endozoicomonas numazuensis]